MSLALAGCTPKKTLNVSQLIDSPGRIAVVSLGFQNRSGHRELEAVSVAANELVIRPLEAVKKVRLIDLSDRASDENHARECIQKNLARWVIWGEYGCSNEQWFATVRMCGTGSEPVMTFTAASANWNEVVRKLNGQILNHMALQPDDAERKEMDEMLSRSPEALVLVGNAYICEATKEPLPEAEGWLRKAIETDPRLDVAHVELARVLDVQQKSTEAEQILRRLLKSRPDSAGAHKMLGIILMEKGKLELAEQQFMESMRCSPDDAAVLGRLGDLFMQQFRADDAVKVLGRSLELSPDATYSPLVSNLLTRANVWLKPAPFQFTPPANFSAADLRDAVQRQIGPERMKWFFDPFETTPEMRDWAVHITRGASNDEEKARRLFKALAVRVQNGCSEQGGRMAMRSSSQVFAEWNSPGIHFCCRDYTLVYVALARSVGIKAYVTYVQEQDSGSKVQHGCAAIMAGKSGFLVDLTLLEFGAGHKIVTVQTDLQVTGLLMSQFPETERKETALLLAPDCALVQLNYFLRLMENGRIREAKEIVPKLRVLDTVASIGDYAEGIVALKQDRVDDAIQILKTATCANPHEVDFHVRLAQAYARKGRLDDARESLRNAQKCPEMPRTGEDLAKLIDDQPALVAWGNTDWPAAAVPQGNK
jgi:predicted Zn-dependent protease